MNLVTGGLKRVTRLLAGRKPRVKAEHRGYKLKAVADAMVHVCQKRPDLIALSFRLGLCLLEFGGALGDPLLEDLIDIAHRAMTLAKLAHLSPRPV